MSDRSVPFNEAFPRSRPVLQVGEEPPPSEGGDTNGVSIQRLARLVDTWDERNGEPVTQLERFVIKKVRRIMDRMASEGYPESMIEAHVMRTMFEEARVKTFSHVLPVPGVEEKCSD